MAIRMVPDLDGKNLTGARSFQIVRQIDEHGLSISRKCARDFSL